MERELKDTQYKICSSSSQINMVQDYTWIYTNHGDVTTKANIRGWLSDGKRRSSQYIHVAFDCLNHPHYLFKICVEQTLTNTGQAAISYWLCTGRGLAKNLCEHFKTFSLHPLLG
jgi:hypothetical protein